MKEIKISEILNLLENGVTRYSDSPEHDPQVGSIEERYGLSKQEVKRMFEHPLLAGKKTKKAPSFRLIDDVTTDTLEQPIVTDRVYGKSTRVDISNTREVILEPVQVEERPDIVESLPENTTESLPEPALVEEPTQEVAQSESF